MIGTLLKILSLTFVGVCGKPTEEEIRYYERLITEHNENGLTYQYPTNAYEYYSTSTQENYGSFDFVIIGAGPGGSVSANRLTEVKNWTVLLLEAGHWGDDFTNIPDICAPVSFTRFNWAFNSTPQTTACQGLVNRVCYYPRGKGMGGCSLINALMQSRGYKTDYDTWAELSGNERWAFSTVLNYFKKFENFVHRDPEAPYDPEYHGKGGYLSVEYHLKRSPLLNTFLDANKELGYDTVDYNANKLGVSPTQTFTLNGTRFDDAKAFIKPIKDRKNLKILTGSFVTKIRITKETKTATGVEFTHNGKNYFVEAKKEVILCAGTISSPMILMHSGVGPKSHLQELGIEMIEDLPVGTTLRDNAAFYALIFTSNYTEPERSLRDDVIDFLNGEGPLTIADNAQGIGYYESIAIKGTGVPEIELELVPPASYGDLFQKYMAYTDESYEDISKNNNISRTFRIDVIASHPRSSGTIRLKNNNPFEYPLIDSNFLSDPENVDINIMYEAIQLALNITKTKSFRDIGAKLQNGPVRACKQHEFLSKDYWFCALRQFTSNLYHPSGTCSMGRDPIKGAVVDSELKVFGVKNLRVADASVMPTTLAGHGNAPVLMIGEQLADLVKETYNQKP